MIGGLEMLRGLAATLVVLFHLQAAAIAEGFNPGIFGWFMGGEVGVDVFFVLSGFVIFHAVRGRAELRPVAFLRQRFWRIGPPYWVTLALTLLVLAAQGAVRNDWENWPSLWSIAVSVLLLPLPGQVMPVAWTLTIEALFYVLFATTFFRLGTRGALCALTLWALMTQLLRFLPEPLPPAYGLISYSGVIEFLYGGLIATAVASGWQRGAYVCLCFGTLGIVAVVSGTVPLHWGREWVAGLPAAALVYGLAASNWKVPSWALIWGESSYVLYLIHLFVFSITGTLLRIVGVAPYGSNQAMLVLAVLALSVSVTATLWLERPYRLWTRR